MVQNAIQSPKETGQQPVPNAIPCFWAKTDNGKSNGKPAISVRDHCLNVGCVAKAIVEQLPAHLRQQLPEGIPTLAALHDIGKISSGFQVKCQAWCAEQPLGVVSGRWTFSESNHAKVSQRFLDDRVGRHWAAAVGPHHGKILYRRSGKSPSLVEEKKEWFEEQRKEVSKAIETVLGPLPPLDKPSDSVLWYVAGLISVADWLGSNEVFFPLEWPEIDDPRIDYRLQLGKSCLQLLGWHSQRPTTNLGFGSLFGDSLKDKPPFIANSLQQAVADQIDRPGLYIIEGQMGCGKTEAALYAAYRLMDRGFHHGFFFGLPTQVTSNRIHRRVEQFLARSHSDVDAPNSRLVHANSWLMDSESIVKPSYSRSKNDDDNPEEHARNGRSWFGPTKRALLAQYGVGTIDQALLGIVGAKHFFVRQFGLAGKVVILDEVHSYDLYTGTLIDRLIERLLDLKCTVIVLSATLTEERRRSLLSISGANVDSLSTAYPLLTGVTDQKQSFEIAPDAPQERFVQVASTNMSTNEIAEECLRRAEGGACVLWIRNTVKLAQESWRVLKGINRVGGPQIGLLHSRFPHWRREQLEEEWITILGKDTASRPSGCVLVSTQVVEQSVDIDADFLVTDLAPTDMLLQRLGRLWRHHRDARPASKAEVWITVPDFASAKTSKEIRKALGGSGRVYAPYVLLRSWRVWSAIKTLVLPTDIRLLLEATYQEDCLSQEPESWKELQKDIEQFRAKQQSLAEALTRVESESTLEDEEDICTRWNTQPTASLLLLKDYQMINQYSGVITASQGDQVTVREFNRDLLAARIIHENLVKLPYYLLEEACANSPSWIRNFVQGPCAVGVLEGNNIKLLDSSSTNLMWHLEEGVSVRGLQQSNHTNRTGDNDEPCD